MARSASLPTMTMSSRHDASGASSHAASTWSSTGYRVSAKNCGTRGAPCFTPRCDMTGERPLGPHTEQGRFLPVCLLYYRQQSRSISSAANIAAGLCGSKHPPCPPR